MVRPLVIVVRPNSRARTVIAWLRKMVPAAILVAAPPALDQFRNDVDVIALDAGVADAGPLAIADAIAKMRGRS